MSRRSDEAWRRVKVAIRNSRCRVSRVKRSDTGQVQLSAYMLHYKLDLWSTFTYFLKDPAYGDQMLQHDDRTVYGFKASKTWFWTLAAMPMTNVIGVQARVDDIGDVGIFPSFERHTMARLRMPASWREAAPCMLRIRCSGATIYAA